nr:retrovirus-related Pol polyprotein from transposon TNT 1-94 [Tanacetum cinerariifolium]
KDLRKLQPTADIGIFVGYAPSRKGYGIYSKRTRRIMETIHVQFDELTEPMAPVHLSTGPAPIFLTPGQISLGLIPNLVPAAPYVPFTNKDLEILFQLMFDEYLEPPRTERLISPAPTVEEQSIQPVYLHLPPLIKMHILQVFHHHLRHYNLIVYIKALQLNLLSWKTISLLPLTIVSS